MTDIGSPRPADISVFSTNFRVLHSIVKLFTRLCREGHQVKKYFCAGSGLGPFSRWLLLKGEFLAGYEPPGTLFCTRCARTPTS